MYKLIIFDGNPPRIILKERVHESKKELESYGRIEVSHIYLKYDSPDWAVYEIKEDE